MLCDLTAALGMSNHHNTCIITCAFIPMLYQGKRCSKHVLHCSNCNPSQSCCHIMCFVSIQEIARHLRPATLRALYGKNKVQNGVHCTDLPDDGILEVRSCKSHSNTMLRKSHKVTFCLQTLLLALRMFVRLQKYFWIPQMLMKPRTKWHPGLMTVCSGPRQTYSPVCLTGREAGG